MSLRRIYLAKYRTSARQRAHFAIFIPSGEGDRASLAQDFNQVPTIGTIINVVGEPVMAGFTHVFKRNYVADSSHDLVALVPLDTVDAAHLFEAPVGSLLEESTPRGRLEREAVVIAPPPRGQDVRAPIDGVNTKRCQEWTMEFLRRLASQGIIHQEAVERAQAQRDPPNHGIFGASGPAAATTIGPPAAEQ